MESWTNDIVFLCSSYASLFPRSRYHFSLVLDICYSTYVLLFPTRITYYHLFLSPSLCPAIFSLLSLSFTAELDDEGGARTEGADGGGLGFACQTDLLPMQGSKSRIGTVNCCYYAIYTRRWADWAYITRKLQWKIAEFLQLSLLAMFFFFFFFSMSS